MRFLGTDWQMSVFSLQLYLSTMVTLIGTEESGHCREGETRVNVCTVHPKNWLLLRVSHRGEVAVCEGLTVLIYVKNVLCFIYHRQLPSLTQLHTLHLRNTQVKTLWYILILNNIFLSVFVHRKLELYRVWWFKEFIFCPFQRTVTNMPGKLESLVNLTGNLKTTIKTWHNCYLVLVVYSSFCMRIAKSLLSWGRNTSPVVCSQNMMLTNTVKNSSESAHCLCYWYLVQLFNIHFFCVFQ